jgi:hypothetical protein
MFILDIGQTTTHRSGALPSRRLWFLSYGVETEYRPSLRSLPPHFCAVADLEFNRILRPDNEAL